MLKDDPAAGHLILCKVLHLQYDLPKPLRAQQLYAWAEVAEKYDCTNAISLTLDASFSTEDLQSPSFRDIITLTASAYRLDHRGIFRSYNRVLMLRGTGKPWTFAECLPFLPTMAWFTLESQRSAAVQKYLTAFSKLSKRTSPAGSDQGPHMLGCPLQLLDNIREAKLDAIDMDRDGIVTLEEKARTLVLSHWTPLFACCTFQRGLPSTVYKFVAAVGAVKDGCFGLCLDCVRAGGKNEGKCRVQHP